MTTGGTMPGMAPGAGPPRAGAPMARWDASTPTDQAASVECRRIETSSDRRSITQRRRGALRRAQVASRQRQRGNSPTNDSRTPDAQNHQRRNGLAPTGPRRNRPNLRHQRSTDQRLMRAILRLHAPRRQVRRPPTLGDRPRRRSIRRGACCPPALRAHHRHDGPRHRPSASRAPPRDRVPRHPGREPAPIGRRWAGRLTRGRRHGRPRRDARRCGGGR